MTLDHESRPVQCASLKSKSLPERPVARSWPCNPATVPDAEPAVDRGHPFETSRTSVEGIHAIGDCAVRVVHRRICIQTHVRIRVLPQGNDPHINSFAIGGGLPTGSRGTNSSTMCPLLRGRQVSVYGVPHPSNSATLSPCDCSLLGRPPRAALVVPGYRRSPFGGRQRHTGCSCRCREQTWSPVRPGRSP